ncbi:MAG: Gfo/Idh/MocA family oxidoreductase [Candidatus Omnitrophica bacterium]|nr:Gfo/Idh/MocA family oxidoreductase [Candidatus Omnitrophota bacterium]
MKNGTAAAAAATAFSVLPSKNARAQKPITVGVIGCGGRGRGAMINSIQSCEDVQIKFICDILPDRIAKAKEELAKLDRPTNIEVFQGFKAYQEAVKMDVDYVILATPPCYRPETLEAAVEAKKNVFMEKPAAVDPQGIRRIIAAGDKASTLGLNIAAGTQRRHSIAYQEAIQRIHEGAIGDIMNAQVFWCGGPIGFGDKKPGMTDLEWQMRSWYHFGWLSGDHIVEQHVHNLDVINWIMGGHPVKSFGSGGCGWQERGDIWDHHAIHFEYENGTSILSMASQHPRKTSRVDERVQGVKGRCYTAQNGPWRILDAKGKEMWKFSGEHHNELPYIQEHADLIQCIRSGDYINEAKNVAESTMTAILGRMAEYSGEEMTWDQAYQSDERYPIYYELRDLPAEKIPVPGGEPYDVNAGWKPG